MNLVKIIVFLLLIAAPTLHSASAADYFSPRIAALSGAGKAGPLLNDSILLNPSFTPFLPTHSIAASYFNYNGPNAFRGRNYHVSIQDGRSEYFQAGASYTMREDASFVHVGASRTAVQRLGFGVSGKFFLLNGGRTSGQDITFSTTWIISNWLQAALVADNLLENANGKSMGMYREIALALKINVQGILLIYLDPHYTPSLSGTQKVGHAAGLEFVMFRDFFLRVGQSHNSLIPFESARGRTVSAGAGWVAPRISIDFGITRALEPRYANAFSMGTTLYF
jgi:hypothetical protein